MGVGPYGSDGSRSLPTAPLPLSVHPSPHRLMQWDFTGRAETHCGGELSYRVVWRLELWEALYLILVVAFVIWLAFVTPKLPSPCSIALGVA